MSWYVYIIQAKNGNLYTGISTDVERRFKQHLGELAGGAKYFRGNPPRKLVYIEQMANRSDASKREAAIKKFTRKEKKSLINQCHQKEFRSVRLERLTKGH